MSGATDKAYRHIKDGILAGTLASGSRLKEEELAQAIGVSRTPVRDALRRLKLEGLVDFVANQGAHVTAWTGEEMEEISTLRALLESYAAELAAHKIGPDTLDELDRLAGEMEACLPEADGRIADFDRVAALNARFHRLIVAAAGNARLKLIIGQLMEVPLTLRKFARFDRARLERSFAHHREIVGALRARDPQWAGAAMRTHILAARAYDAPLAGPRREAANDEA